MCWCYEIDINTGLVFSEPCRGEGNIYNRVDCREKKYCEIREGRDYLTTSDMDADLIITNPPFTLTEQFIEKSLSEANTVCYFQKLNFFGGQERKKKFCDKIQKPNKLFISSRRPSFVDICKGHHKKNGLPKIKGCGSSFQKTMNLKKNIFGEKQLKKPIKFMD